MKTINSIAIVAIAAAVLLAVGTMVTPLVAHADRTNTQKKCHTCGTNQNNQGNGGNHNSGTNRIGDTNNDSD
jgi:uncharacterized membrane protein